MENKLASEKTEPMQLEQVIQPARSVMQSNKVPVEDEVGKIPLETVRQGVIWSEILGPPLALREQ